MFVAFAILVNACAHPTSGPAVAPVVTPLVSDDRLRTDDVLDIRVVGEAEMSGDYRIGPDGQIQFPYAGYLKVAGLRVGDVHEMITTRLKEEYLRNPQVAVHVKEWNSRKISVLGEVNKPGAVQFFSGMTIVDAIAAAGGFTKSASTNSVVLRRETGTQVKSETCKVAEIGEGRAPNVPMLPGDLIVVGERMF